MSFTRCATTFHDVYIIEPRVFEDSRGFFMETYSSAGFGEIGIVSDFVQDNYSRSKKGVLRGLHFQVQKPQAKLVRVVVGSVYDVIVDLRKDSSTFGKWEGFILSAQNKKMLYIPRGFAHGFLALEDDTEIVYKCDDFYDAEGEGSIKWDDVSLNINWREIQEKYSINSIQVSKRDNMNMDFEQYLHNPIF